MATKKSSSTRKKRTSKAARHTEKRDPLLTEVGYVGQPNQRHRGKYFGVGNDHEFIAKLRRDPKECYREMWANHHIIGGARLVMELLVRSAEWSATPAENSGEAGQEWADWLTGAVGDMETSFDTYTVQSISMYAYGFSAHEKVLKLRNGASLLPEMDSKFNDGLYGIRALAPRSQRTICGWETDQGTGRILGAYQETDFGKVLIPAERLLILRREDENGNPEGQSLLRNAYVSYTRHKKYSYWLDAKQKRNAAGILQISLPPHLMSAENAEFVQKYQDLAEGIAVSDRMGFTFPSKFNPDANKSDQYQESGYDIELLSGSDDGKSDLLEAMTALDRNIAMSLGALFLVIGANGSGSHAQSADQTGLFLDNVQSLLEMIAHAFNHQVVAPLFRLNGVAPELIPTWKPHKLKKTSLEQFAEAARALGGVGLVQTTLDAVNTAHDKLGLPSIEEEDFLGEEEI